MGMGVGLALGCVQPMVMSTLHQITPPHRHGEAVVVRELRRHVEHRGELPAVEDHVLVDVVRQQPDVRMPVQHRRDGFLLGEGWEGKGQ